MGSLFTSSLLAHGASDVPVDMQLDTDASLHHRAQAVLGKHVRGKRLKPLMREYDHILHVVGPHDLIMPCHQLRSSHKSFHQAALRLPLQQCCHHMPNDYKPLFYRGMERGKDNFGKWNTGLLGLQKILSNVLQTYRTQDIFWMVSILFWLDTSKDGQTILA